MSLLKPFLLTIFTFAVTQVCAQSGKDLSQDEVTFFFSLITRSKEYREVKRVLDSVNAVSDPTMPQEIDMKIHKRAGDEENYVAHAYLERRLALGITVERYVYEYDRRSRKITTVTKEKTRVQLEQH